RRGRHACPGEERQVVRVEEGVARVRGLVFALPGLLAHGPRMIVRFFGPRKGRMERKYAHDREERPRRYGARVVRRSRGRRGEGRDDRAAAREVREEGRAARPEGRGGGPEGGRPEGGGAAVRSAQGGGGAADRRRGRA